METNSYFIALNFEADVVATVGAAILIQRFLDQVGSWHDINCVEASLSVVAGGSGGTPSLAVILQSSPDNFATASLIKDVITFTPVTATGGQVVRARASDTILFQRDFRLKIDSTTASGSKTFAGKVTLSYFHD